jgi:hemolysin III
MTEGASFVKAPIFRAAHANFPLWFPGANAIPCTSVNQLLSNPPRVYSQSEEIIHSFSHAAGFIATLVGAPFLVLAALHHGTVATLVGVCVFALTSALLYLASAIYHAMPQEGKAKVVCEIIDHAAIYLLIAGTYTPFTLGVLRGAMGWTLFGLVWTLALTGVLLKSINGVTHPRVSMWLYIGMGWLVVIAVKPLVANLAPAGLAWMAGGGLAYTGGCLFYAHKQWPFGHFIWHLFVLAGTTCHYFAILWYAI